ncbi:MAG: ACT domain-containing protein [Anaerolineales bacterium]
MNKNIVLTLTGHDRIGIVEEITNMFVKHGGNVESSRMARLGGEFAMLMLVALADEEFAALEKELQRLRDQGFQLTLLQTEDDHAKKYAGWLPYVVEVLGADHEGIIYEIASHLAKQGCQHRKHGNDNNARADERHTIICHEGDHCGATQSTLPYVERCIRGDRR